MSRSPPPFNNPFGDPALRRQLQAVARAAPTATPSPPVRPRARRTLTPDEEDALWEEATRGGRPLLQRGVRVTAQQVTTRSGLVGPDDDAFAALCRFVRGEGAFDLGDGDEFVESPPGFADPVLLGRLRRGEFSVQAWVDLHGLQVDEAREVMFQFFRRARQVNHRCVLVVHGRGLHSRDGVSVLKERVATWLGAGAMSRQVLAFCTARQADGGAGALYVLLRPPNDNRKRRRRRRASALA